MAKDRHRRGKKRRRTSSSSDASEVVIKKEKSDEPEVPESVDESGDEEVSDVSEDEDGDWPHKLHLALPNQSASSEITRKAHQMGFRIRLRTYSDREQKQLLSNISEIMNSQPVSDSWKTRDEYEDVFRVLCGLFTTVKTESGLRKRDILGRRVKGNPMACPHRQFYFKLGRGLPRRTIFNIIKYCREHYANLRTIKSLTDAEMQQVVEMKRQSHSVSRNAYANRVTLSTVNNVGYRYLTPDLKDRIRTSFTVFDDAKLVRAIKRQLSLKRIEDYEEEEMKINFTEVAKQVPGRTYIDCRNRFRYHIIPLFGTEEMALLLRKRKHINMDKAKILYFIDKEEIESEWGLNDAWPTLRDKMPDLTIPSAYRLFNDLMAKVPDKKELLTFRDKVEWLMDNVFPKLTKDKPHRIKQVEDFYNAPIRFGKVKQEP
jgi:hypothetical protein